MTVTLNTTALLRGQRASDDPYVDVPASLVRDVRNALWELLDGGLPSGYQHKHGNTYVGGRRLAEWRKLQRIAERLDEEFEEGFFGAD